MERYSAEERDFIQWNGYRYRAGNGNSGECRSPGHEVFGTRRSYVSLIGYEMLRLLSFLFLVSAFFSCLPEKTALERALREAGDNRMELEKVLAYYRDDTLKYQAACFLIENMPDQYAVLPLDSTDTYARA